MLSNGKVGLPIVIWSGDFDENSGGSIVLHALAYRLRQAGQGAFLSNQQSIRAATEQQRLGKWLFALKQANRKRIARRRGTDLTRRDATVACHSTMPVPTYDSSGHQPFIAVYPEIIDGNPFGAQFVVRWLLHRPGFHMDGIRHGSKELTFFYQKAFAESLPDVPEDNLLQVRWLRSDIYRNEEQAGRFGICRMIRKGKATFNSDMARGDAAPLLDGMSHSEIAAIFNRCRYFYCHDPYTMYLYYAALCGCIPVVVPQPGLDAATWRAGFEIKQGVAYGEDEIPFAVDTRDGLLADMAAAREAEDQGVLRFVSKVKARFGC